jgi:hypothetical protein
MTDSPTMRLPIARLDPDEVRRLRRQGSADRERAADLDLYLRGGVRNRPTALAIAARMSARGEEQTMREAEAVRVLMKRYDLSSTLIRRTQQRLPGS